MQPKTPRRVEDRIVAAIETGARLRRPDPSASPADPIEGLMDMIESEAARIRGNDLSALSAILGHQALALDTIFAEVAKKPPQATSCGTSRCASRSTRSRKAAPRSTAWSRSQSRAGRGCARKRKEFPASKVLQT